jgi:phospholipid/cholesterol/gamma-HCH transport system substrate-binding protein/paraquat-inducible protein B
MSNNSNSNSNSNPNYFRLGIFVLAAIGVLLAVVLTFGSGQFFKKSFTVETYIKQSVTGLDAGAAVRFRGVKIGQVNSISLSGDLYEQDVKMTDRREYVVVRMQIFGDKVRLDNLDTYLKDNLRTRVKSMGITGVNYIELDFYPSAENYLPLRYTWKPEYPVVPSMPNQADEIFSGIEKLITGLNGMNVVETQKKLDALLVNLNLLMAGNGKDNAGLIHSAKDLNILLDRIAKATDRDQLNVLMRELVATMVSLRQTVTSMQGDTTATLENLRLASEQLNEFTRVASQSPSTLIWGEPPARITPPVNGAQK